MTEPIVNPEEFFSKKQIEEAKKLGEKQRQLTGDNAFMTEAELTENERESRVPLARSDKGLYRMYKWHCHVCNIDSIRLPYSQAMIQGRNHAIEFKHPQNMFNPPVSVIGGNFKKEMLYK